MKVNDELKKSVQGSTTSTKNSSTDTRSESEVQSRIGPDLGFLSKEAYNLLRTNLLFSFPDDDSGKGKVVGITSSIPHEGKSTVALNLAYSLAENNYRVIAVECDFRRPSFAKIMNVTKHDGLSNFLTNRKKSVIYQNILHENMSVIFAGDTPPNPSELLGSQQMKVVLDMLTQKYDFIIVDMPPVTSVSDPLVLSKELDGVLMVVRHNYVTRKNVTEAMRQLQFTHTRILGFVYNDYIEKDALGVGYGDKYYSKYGKYSRYGGKYGGKYGKYYRYREYYNTDPQTSQKSEKEKSSSDKAEEANPSDLTKTRK